jgi:phage FluMu protein Com
MKLFVHEASAAKQLRCTQCGELLLHGQRVVSDEHPRRYKHAPSCENIEMHSTEEVQQ